MKSADKYIEEYDNQMAALNATDAAAKAKGELLGRYIQHAYADSFALYKIVSVTAKHAKIRVVEIGDAWVLPAWGHTFNLPIAKAKAFLAQRDGIAALFKHSDNFYASLKPGQLVHYDNGFNNFVRCEVVATAEGNKLKPLALVGKWTTHDLPRWQDNGEAHFPHHPKRIREGELFAPNESNIYEANPKGKEDPRGLAPLSLELPERTPEQIAAHRIGAKWHAVRKALEVNWPEKDNYAAALVRAARILNSVED